MNIYAVVILFTLLLSFLLNLVTNLLNLSGLRPQLPKEFENIYEADSYSKSQNYTRILTKFGFLTSSFGLLVTLAFWFSGGFNYLDQGVGAWNDKTEWFQGSNKQWNCASPCTCRSISAKTG